MSAPLPLPPPPPRPRSPRSRSRIVLISRSRRCSSSFRLRASSAAFSESIFSCISSSFLASSNSFGTPWGLLWALKQSFQSSLQNPAVSLSRNPVSWICNLLISGCRAPSRRLKHNSITTSSSLPRISEILPAIHFFKTSTLTFCMSTF